METRFLVLTLEEKTVVTHVRLGDSLDLQTEFTLIPILEGSFETELQALKRVEEIKQTFDGMVEIRKVFI